MKDGEFYYFHGGLGDVLLNVYRQRTFSDLETIDHPVRILLAVGNPHVNEIFTFQKNSGNFLLLDASHKRIQLAEQGLSGRALSDALWQWAGFGRGGLQNSSEPPPPDWKPRYEAPDALDFRGHVLLNPFAGNQTRTFPPQLSDKVLEAAAKRHVICVGRDFLRVRSGRQVHRVEHLSHLDIPFYKNLTVPATLLSLRTARAFIGTHSALAMAAAFEGTPSLVFYPKAVAHDVESGKSYGFYARLDHMTAVPMETAEDFDIENWLDRIEP